MNIVANSFFLRNLRNLPFFTLDLGKSRKLVNDDNNRFRKLNEFQLRYENLYGNKLMEFGNINNKIKFYDDVNIKEKLILIFKDEDIYEIQWNDKEIENIEGYILETLRKIDETEEVAEETDQENFKKVEEYADDNDHDLWQANDIKNNGRKYLIDQTLSKEEYRKKLMNIMKK